jgi:hypothetical protein
LTGIHLVLYRAAGMTGLLNYQRRNRLRFVDSMMHRYAYDQLGQRWARTKVATARHLTWDLYAQPDHPYARMKASKTLDEHWRHERYCGFTALGHDGRQRHHDPTPD